MFANVIFICKTDGDMDFLNSDSYFIANFEEYTKTFSVPIENFDEEFSLFIKNINERVFNRYTQHQGLIDIFKNLKVEDFYEKGKELSAFNKQILNGNQDVAIYVSVTTKPQAKLLNAKLEDIEYENLPFSELLSLTLEYRTKLWNANLRTKSSNSDEKAEAIKECEEICNELEKIQALGEKLKSFQ